MVTLLRGGDVFAPLPLGKRDILILGSKIAAVSNPGKIKITGLPVLEEDASDKMVIPGFIDSHVHILGGGGEGGPATRAPEITIQSILASGVTTLIGCLGTDGTTRHMESLLAKAKGLEIEGVTTYIFSGSYQFPVVTITGSVRSDILMIEKIIGAGEIAISDHRSSQPTFEEFARLAAECRVGGMLGQKAGVLHCHLGDGPRKLELLFRLISETEIPITQIIPTHVNRNPELLDEAIRFMLQGGYMDLTAGMEPTSDEGHISIAKSLKLCLEKNAPLDHITISSDGNGSMPVFDDTGQLIGLTIATQKSLWTNFRFLLEQKVLCLEKSIRLFSTTPAVFYKLKRKGEIKPGMDADLLLLDEDFNLTASFAMGQKMMDEGKLLIKSTFS
ncbi:MAG: beta-aspartyl-peptidase [Candidatus Aminicenantes bacterium]|nr:MAG: beta-aspartyl-peptidase [Candidatus Aminicenantes bacterium]